MISDYFRGSEKDKDDSEVKFSYKKQSVLRYGENPHQESNFYIKENEFSIIKQLHGKALSYNNYFDIESAITIAYEFSDLCSTIIKHSNPCGFGLGINCLDAYRKAVSTDPISYFGGVVAFNKEVDEEVANEMNKSFLECIVAPSFNEKSLKLLKKKKNLRLIVINKNDLFNLKNSRTFKSVFNGLLFQRKDNFIKTASDFKVVSDKKPDKEQFNALLLGWKLVKFVKSNAIVFNNNQMLLGVGAGQTSRIDSVKIAIRKSKENGLNLAGSIMASDAFFPFSDSIELAKKTGAVGIIQPGGSIKDKEIIEVSNKLNLIMIFTSERHFYH